MRLTALSRALVVVAALASLAAAPATARERFAIHGERLNDPYLRLFYDDGGPELVSGGVAYVDEPGDRAHVVYRAPGQAPRRLEQFEELLAPKPAEGLAGFLELTADGKRLALARHDSDPLFGPKEGPGAVVTARLDGAARTVVRCKHGLEWGPQLDGRGLLILSGPRGSRCDSPLRSRVFDLVSGDVFTLPTDESASDPTIGGRYAIWDEQVGAPRGIVYDFRAGHVVHTSRDFDPMAIGRDGTVVAQSFTSETGRPDDPCGHLWTYDALAPAPHELPYFTCKPHATRIVGTRIVFLAGAKDWPLRGPRQRLMLGDTSGSPARPLSERYAWDANGSFGFDFDGDRVVYRTYTCDGRRLLTVDEVATALAEGPMRTRGCPASVDTPEGPVDIARGFDVTVDCPRGCDGRFDLISEARYFKLVTPHPLPLSPGRHGLHLRAPAAKPATDRVRPGEVRFHARQPDGHTAFVFASLKVRQPKR